MLQGGPFDFDQFSVQFNSFYGASGAISFAGTWPIKQSRYKLTMVPQQSTVQVTALGDSLTMSADQSADMVLGAAAGTCALMCTACCSSLQYCNTHIPLVQSLLLHCASLQHMQISGVQKVTPIVVVQHVHELSCPVRFQSTATPGFYQAGGTITKCK